MASTLVGQLLVPVLPHCFCLKVGLQRTMWRDSKGTFLLGRPSAYVPAKLQPGCQTTSKLESGFAGGPVSQSSHYYDGLGNTQLTSFREGSRRDPMGLRLFVNGVGCPGTAAFTGAAGTHLLLVLGYFLPSSLFKVSLQPFAHP